MKKDKFCGESREVLWTLDITKILESFGERLSKSLSKKSRSRLKHMRPEDWYSLKAFLSANKLDPTLWNRKLTAMVVASHKKKTTGKGKK